MEKNRMRRAIVVFLVAFILTLSVGTVLSSGNVSEEEEAHSYNTCRRGTHWNGPWRVTFIGTSRSGGFVYMWHNHTWAGIAPTHLRITNCGPVSST
jgi:hypothetical protein